MQTNSPQIKQSYRNLNGPCKTVLIRSGTYENSINPFLFVDLQFQVQNVSNDNEIFWPLRIVTDDTGPKPYYICCASVMVFHKYVTRTYVTFFCGGFP